MTTQCIHGFPTEHCSSCRTCAHGQPSAACVRCREATAVRRPAHGLVQHPSQSHLGYEIFYEPDVSGWRYRAEESAPSALSYRSAFLARRAVEQVAGPDAGVATATARPSKRRK